MSEQSSIDSLQFVAQLAPQALNSAAESKPPASADFRKFLLEQRVTAGNGLQSDAPAVSEESTGVGLLPLLSANTPGGNTLPPGGSSLQSQAASRIGLSLSQLASAAGMSQAGLITDEATALAAAHSDPNAKLVEQALSVAGRSLSASLAPTSASATQGQTGITSDELLSEPDNLLQSLLGNKNASVRSNEGEGDSGRPQFVQQLSANIAQPQASVVTYTTVAPPQTTPLAPESGLLSSQPLQTVSIDVPVQSSEWSRAFAERAVWLVNNQQSAQLRLTPASLGQIDIQVRVKDDEASIVFNTQNNMVRETVEASLPRLRDMLESQGLNLVDVNVNDGESPEQHGFDSAFDNVDRPEGEETESTPIATPLPMLVSSAALDLYV